MMLTDCSRSSFFIESCWLPSDHRDRGRVERDPPFSWPDHLSRHLASYLAGQMT